MNLLIVGCGYVADMYVASLANHPGLRLTGAFDWNPERLAAFSRHHRVRAFPSLEDALASPDVDLVVNLTNPRSHYAVSRAALTAGKHVYSEKPLALSVEEGRELVDLAEATGLMLGSAPCTVLGEAAQTIWRELRAGTIGVPRLVYAELSDGPIPLMNHSSWQNDSGAAWPAHDEFEIGCTIEHAGYGLTWLTTFFGPVQRVHVSAHTILPDKGISLADPRPDLTFGVLEFRSGVVARLTCDIYASHDHRMRIFGDAGILDVDEVWDMGSAVHYCPRTPEHLRSGLLTERYPPRKWMPWFRPRRVPLVRKPAFRYGGSRGAYRIDFMRGVRELVEAHAEKRPCRLSARWALHVLEIVLALGASPPGAQCCTLESTFEPAEPMPWAQ